MEYDGNAPVKMEERRGKNMAKRGVSRWERCTTCWKTYLCRCGWFGKWFDRWWGCERGGGEVGSSSGA